MEELVHFPIAQYIVRNGDEFLLTSDGQLYFVSKSFELATSQNLLRLLEDHDLLSIQMNEQNLFKDIVMENTSRIDFTIESKQLFEITNNPHDKIIHIYANESLINNSKLEIKKFHLEHLFNTPNINPITITTANDHSTDLYPTLSFLWNNERVRCFNVDTRSNCMCIVTESNSIYVFGSKLNYIGKKCKLSDSCSLNVLEFIRLRPPKLACNKSEYCENEFSTSNDFQITNVTCGQCCVIVQCRNFDIYVIGENSALLIGLEFCSFYNMLTPLRIFELEDHEYVKQVVCLNSCTLFLTCEGRVFFTGLFKSRSKKRIDVFKPSIVGRVCKISGDASNVAFLMDDRQTVCCYSVSLRFGEMVFNTSPEKGHIIDICCVNSSIQILTSEGFIENLCFSHQRMKELIQDYGLESTKTSPVIIHDLYNITPFYFNTTEINLFPIVHPSFRIVQFFIYNESQSYITRIETRNVKYFKENLYNNLTIGGTFPMIIPFSDISFTNNY